MSENPGFPPRFSAYHYAAITFQRQTSKSIQLDPVHAAINFTDRNNWQSKYQTHEGKINLQGDKSLTQSTKKHRSGAFSDNFVQPALLLQFFLSKEVRNQGG